MDSMTESNGFMDLAQVLREYSLENLGRLHILQPEPGMARFGSLDCRDLQIEHPGIAMLSSVADLYFHLCADPVDAPGNANLLSGLLNNSGQFCTDRVGLAAELSSSWCTAMCLGNRRVAGIPGNWVLRFDPGGELAGTGQDIWGEFALSGFWTVEGLVLIRKQASSLGRPYVVDLLGFLNAKRSMRGIWLFNGQAGGFWAWQGERRELHRPPTRQQLLGHVIFSM